MTIHHNSRRKVVTRSGNVLILNAGSSSIKFSVFALDGDELSLDSRGQVEGIGTKPHFVAKDASGASLRDETFEIAGPDGHGQALRRMNRWLRKRLADDRLVAVGHRVVHGGADFAASVAIDEAVLERLEALVPLAPLHQPHNLAAIRAIQGQMPGLLQVACFDTAFHRNHPELADWFALPRRFYDEGIRRYGFHGLSYEYIAHALREVAPDVANGRVVVAHLGSGASMGALHNGRSMDSTMGFTALDGLPMGTRPGALDPGVVLHLMRAHAMDADALERLLYHECGLKGLSGISNDVRALLASDNPRAARAIDLFVYRICRELGALTAALGGLDGLVFTAGIGERSPEIRARVCDQSAWLGIEIDEQANRAGGPLISTAGSRVRVYAIPTDEELMIARHTLALLRGR
jgi:acetate kinase